ncbi:ABC transporter permease [Microterricola pindariensis]|uniref:Peptide ABC transporter permease n=1 Tax=Microterricola pindariensis TaxID=478010 RepID=A0ABX5B1L3_9MICO|nr:ABC transporter permease [Microterricola pindariensis]PPL20513.1 peptide ABC transporter permease [Microterricola pindariensis]
MSELELRTVAVGARPRVATVRIGTVLAVAFALYLLLACLVPDAVAPQDPNQIAPRDAFSPPSPAHWFGTDESGRDVYSRVVFGTANSLLIGVAATASGLTLGLALAVLAAFGGRVFDFTVNRTIEVLFAFPGLLLALLVIVIAGPGPVTATLAVGLSTAPGYARILRGQLLAVRRSGYVEAARVLGHRPRRILGRHILPNALAPLLVLATLGIGQAIVWASALSFLGLGALPPTAEWGAMLSAGRPYLATAWWLTVFPGLMIVLTAVASTVLGRALTRVRAREGATQ